MIDLLPPKVEGGIGRYQEKTLKAKSMRSMSWPNFKIEKNTTGRKRTLNEGKKSRESGQMKKIYGRRTEGSKRLTSRKA